MYAEHLQVSNYNDRFYRMHINASWITIRDSKTDLIVFERNPSYDNWYDEKHRAIVNAIHALEAAVMAATE